MHIYFISNFVQLLSYKNPLCSLIQHLFSKKAWGCQQGQSCFQQFLSCCVCFQIVLTSFQDFQNINKVHFWKHILICPIRSHNDKLLVLKLNGTLLSPPGKTKLCKLSANCRFTSAFFFSAAETEWLKARPQCTWSFGVKTYETYNLTAAVTATATACCYRLLE